MDLSINTDYTGDMSYSETYLERISEAGFSHIHWCHHWKGDYLYSDYEIEEIGTRLDKYGLKLSDCHGSDGTEKSFYSLAEYRRKAGVELVKNRIDFTSKLGGKALDLHIWTPDDFLTDSEVRKDFLEVLFRTFDELMDFALHKKIKIAIENLEYDTNTEIDLLWGTIFDRYGPEYIGLCYDSGHGVLSDSDTLELLKKYKDRITALHLHENNGFFDQHLIPFTTNLVNWEKLARILAASPYNGAITLEVDINNSISHFRRKNDEMYFLKKCLEAAKKIESLVLKNAAKADPGF